ncbi:duf302 domain-containing protein [Anaeramoeba ignava]|uniref:Duf302 domain-containing protein n=1 Tax=Anaeramoeba ignava TaxID=1746090 RepID=A0A9Q0R4V7_ANAIG|nr:duf302 domain-containing protein [Anaeramoeba ignava]
MAYFLSKKLKETVFEKGLETVLEALKSTGFGILSQIKLSDVIKAKLNEDIGQVMIINACFPKIAFSTLQVDPNAVTLLPCNVTVKKDKGSEEILCLTLEPINYLKIANQSKIDELGEIVSEKLKEVFDKI